MRATVVKRLRKKLRSMGIEVAMGHPTTYQILRVPTRRGPLVMQQDGTTHRHTTALQARMRSGEFRAVYQQAKRHINVWIGRA